MARRPSPVARGLWPDSPMVYGPMVYGLCYVHAYPRRQEPIYGGGVMGYDPTRKIDLPRYNEPGYTRP